MNNFLFMYARVQDPVVQGVHGRVIFDTFLPLGVVLKTQGGIYPIMSVAGHGADRQIMFAGERTGE